MISSYNFWAVAFDLMPSISFLKRSANSLTSRGSSFFSSFLSLSSFLSFSSFLSLSFSSFSSFFSPFLSSFLSFPGSSFFSSSESGAMTFSRKVRLISWMLLWASRLRASYISSSRSRTFRIIVMSGFTWVQSSCRASAVASSA